MMNESMDFSVPAWVPEGAQRYLAHTEAGQSIRELARGAGCHASTVLRQIRRVEMRRDDPLVNAALQTLAQRHFPQRDGLAAAPRTEMQKEDGQPEFEREAIRVLRRMCEAGSVLAVAEDMDKAVVVRDSRGTGSTRTAIVDSATAQVLALQEWISCDKPGRISRYRITATGRTALGQLIAKAENRARRMRETGFADAQSPFQHRLAGSVSAEDSEDGRRRVRYGVAESPLAALARRKDRNGRPFLDDELVRAGERLREDFELAQLGANVTQNWDSFLTGGGTRDTSPGSALPAGSEARGRVTRALSDLGPGLSEIALRCCCYLEGLEQAERKLDWSARSGKIVLRIALQRLKRHYEDAVQANAMIG